MCCKYEFEKTLNPIRVRVRIVRTQNTSDLIDKLIEYKS